VKLDNLAAWRGVKFRTKGIWANVLQGPEVGAAVTTLASSELYSGLERGILDALEYSTPATDMALAFYEVAKYYMMPGFHQPATMLSDGVNKDAWNKLPADLKAMYDAANRAANAIQYGKFVLADAEALAAYEAMPGVELVVCPEDLQAKFAALADAEYAKQAAADPFFAKVYNSQREFKKQYDFFKGYQSMNF
jgi:TRAP-type mannitol/chloroaromatic compound transport system substrate-binding protein